MPIAKAVGGASFRSAPAIAPSWVIASGRDDHDFRRAAHDRAAHEYQIGRKRGCRRDFPRRCTRTFFRRVGFACEKRFVDIKIAGLDQPSIRGHEIPRRQKHDIAGYDLRGRNIDRRPIAKHFGGNRNPLGEAVGRGLRLVLLRHIQDYGHKHDCGDDGKTRNVSGGRGHGSGEEKNQDQGIAEPLNHGERDAIPPLSADLVGSGPRKDLCRPRRSETLFA